MAETAPTLREVPTHPEATQPEVPQAPQQPLRFRPLLGSLTMMVLTVGGLVVLSPTAATAPRPPRTR
jgi:hypothetical protein